MGLLERMFRGFAGGHHGGRYGGGHHGRRGYFDYGPEQPLEQRVPAIADRRCDKCGGVNLAQARYCQGCGTSLSTATCASCGGEMPSGAQFCNQCGRPR